jgi:creatinine amidohydrolase
MLLTLTPERVHMDRAVRGNTRPIEEILPLLRAKGVRAASDSGILGNPVGAVADEGAGLLDSLATALIDDVAVWLKEKPVWLKEKAAWLKEEPASKEEPA